MKTAFAKAIAVALIQILIVCSLGAKLLYDRRMRPRAWFRTERYDPNLPIRGRYVSLMIDVTDPRSPEEIEKKFGNVQHPTWNAFGQECGSIAVHDGTPAVELDERPPYGCNNLMFERWINASGQTRFRRARPFLC